MRGPGIHTDPRRGAGRPRRLHLLRRFEATTTRRSPRRVAQGEGLHGSRPTRSTSCDSPPRPNRRCCAKTRTGLEDRSSRRSADADPSRGHRSWPPTSPASRASRADRRERYRPRAVRPGQAGDHGRSSRARRQCRRARSRWATRTPTQSEMYAMKGGEKKVFLVSSFQETNFNREAVRPARQEDPQVRSRQGRRAGTLVKGSTTMELAARAASGRSPSRCRPRSDYSAIEGFLTRLSSANMSKLLEENATDLAEVRPRQADDDRHHRRRQLENGARSRQDRGRSNLRPRRVAADGVHARHDVEGRPQEELRRLPQEGVVRVPAVLRWPSCAR